MDPAQGGLGYIEVVSPDRLRLDPMVLTSHNRAAARVEVRPGEDPLNLNAGSTRAEVSYPVDSHGKPINENAKSGTQYFAVSYYFPTSWQSTVKDVNSGHDWSIVFQLHGPNALKRPPSFALMADTSFSLNLFGGDLAVVQPNYPKNYRFSDGKIRLGQWTDFIFMIQFSADSSGHITVWRRDQGQTKFTQVLDLADIPTLQYDSSKGVTPEDYSNWKQGLYRGTDYGITNIFWMGPLVRATTFEAAENSAFKTQSGKP